MTSIEQDMLNLVTGMLRSVNNNVGSVIVIIMLGDKRKIISKLRWYKHV